jgi:acyl-CoA thioesterase-1
MRRAATRYGRLAFRIQLSPRIWAAMLLVFASLGSFSMNSPTFAQTKPLKLVAFGDSLTAGYNLPGSAAFPTVLEKMLRDKGISVEIANAGVSGDTSQGGLERVDWSVPDGTDGVILELGANDALRGVDPALTEKSLDAIVTGLKARGIQVMLAGMYAPRSNGPDYVARFDAIYPKLAEKHGLILYPFFLDGIAGDRVLNQPDMLHPKAEGVRVIAQRILPTVERFLASLRPRS